MELLQETYTFINQEGKKVTATRYYVEVYDINIYVVCKNSSDKRFLDNYFSKKVTK